MIKILITKLYVRLINQKYAMRKVRKIFEIIFLIPTYILFFSYLAHNNMFFIVYKGGVCFGIFFLEH